MNAASAGFVWMNTKEAAGRLGVTTRTLYRFIDEGRLPAYRFGRVIRLKEHEVHDFIESCRIAPGTLGDLDVVNDVDCDGPVAIQLEDASTRTSVTDLTAR